MNSDKKTFREKIADNIPYLGYAVFIMAICISFFSGTTDTSGKGYVFNTKGEKIEVSKINFNPKASDTSKSSLDGQQKLNTPKLDVKPFDPNAPFNKITFRQLRTYVPGKEAPADIRKMNGENVQIIGFMAPLNALENMDEFLLCSSPPLSCYCAPPIFINEMIYVKLQNGLKTDFKTGVINIKGQFKVNFDITDEYSDIIYTIDGVSID